MTAARGVAFLATVCVVAAGCGTQHHRAPRRVLDLRRPQTLSVAVLRSEQKYGTTPDFGVAKSASCDRVPERVPAASRGEPLRSFENRNGVGRDWRFFRCAVLYSSGRPRYVDAAVEPDGSHWVKML
jgi:hypothetical protein